MFKNGLPLDGKEEARRRAVYDKKLSDSMAAKELNISKLAYSHWRRSRNLPAAGMSRSAKHATLCWFCKNTHRLKCSWFDPDNPQPVENWDAEREIITNCTRDLKGGGTKVYTTESYRVKSCPNFEEDI